MSLQTADFGPRTALKIVDQLRKEIKGGRLKSGDEIRTELKASIVALLRQRGGACELDLGDGTPGVVLIVGVNGGGKTTSIGKLAHRFVGAGATVRGSWIIRTPNVECMVSQSYMHVQMWCTLTGIRSLSSGGSGRFHCAGVAGSRRHVQGGGGRAAGAVGAAQRGGLPCRHRRQAAAGQRPVPGGPASSQGAATPLCFVAYECRAESTCLSSCVLLTCFDPVYCNIADSGLLTAGWDGRGAL